MARTLPSPIRTSMILVAAAFALTGCAGSGGAPAEGRISTSPVDVPSSVPDSDSRADEPSAGMPLIVGTWGAASADTAPGEPYIVIGADGTASGNDGCNGFGGLHWTATGATIEFSGGVQTLMACPGIDQWLNRRSTATVDASTMTFFDESGVEIGALPRTG